MHHGERPGGRQKPIPIRRGSVDGRPVRHGLMRDRGDKGCSRDSEPAGFDETQVERQRPIVPESSNGISPHRYMVRLVQRRPTRHSSAQSLEQRNIRRQP